jgi:hypothetical protein
VVPVIIIIIIVITTTSSKNNNQANNLNRESIFATILSHFAHLLVSAAVLEFFSVVESCDVRPVAWHIVCLLKNFHAVFIHLTSKFVKNLRMSWHVTSARCEERSGCGLQTCQGLTEVHKSQVLGVTEMLQMNSTSKFWADSGAPTPENADEKVHRHERSLSHNQSFPNRLANLVIKKSDH